MDRKYKQTKLIFSKKNNNINDKYYPIECCFDGLRSLIKQIIDDNDDDYGKENNKTTHKKTKYSFSVNDDFKQIFALLEKEYEYNISFFTYINNIIDQNSNQIFFFNNKLELEHNAFYVSPIPAKKIIILVINIKFDNIIGFWKINNPQHLTKQKSLFCENCCSVISKNNTKNHRCYFNLHIIQPLNSCLKNFNNSQTNQDINHVVMVLDTETTGLFDGLNPHYSDLINFDSARILQIAWRFCGKNGEQFTNPNSNLNPQLIDEDYYLNFDSEELKPEERFVNPELIDENYYLKFDTEEIDDIVISDGATNIHNISLETVQAKGIERKKWFDTFNKALDKCCYIMGHNISFDISVISSELFRYNKFGLLRKLLSKKLICTKQLGSVLCPQRRDNFKGPPKLFEMYEHYYKSQPLILHRALDDVNTCHQIWKKVFKQLKNIPSPSEEQQKIILSLCSNKNINVNAVAGSGKTTSILQCAQSLPWKQFLVVTYNRRLKDETEERCVLSGIDNIKIHTYHGAAGFFYNQSYKTDKDLNQLIEERKQPGCKTKVKQYHPDIIVVDEAQDMNPTYYKTLMRICRDFQLINIQWWIMGDVMQKINDYNDADHRYLIKSDKLFISTFLNLDDHNNCTRTWDFLDLKTSYRLTDQMANLINQYYLNSSYIKTIRSGPLPKYVVTDFFDEKKSSQLIYSIIKELLLNQGHKPSDIYVLCPSVDHQLIKKIENILVSKKIPCFVSYSQQGQVDKNVWDDKIVFSSFHQSKGLERRSCIVFNVDHGYEIYYSKITNKHIQNAMYVALTRAKENLILLHDNRNSFPSYFNTDLFEKFNLQVDIVGDSIMDVIAKKWVELKTESNEKCIDDDNSNAIDQSVTNLIKHVPIRIINQIMKDITCEEMITFSDSPNTIKLPSITGGQQSNPNLPECSTSLIEHVADINGISIVLYIEYQVLQKMNNQYINDILCFNLEENKLKQQILEDYKNCHWDNHTDFIRLAINIDALTTKFIHRLHQIQNLNWIGESVFQNALTNFQNNISSFQYKKETFEFEYPVNKIICVGNKKFNLTGRFDLFVDKLYVWELKCTNQIEDSHILQLAIYLYMSNCETGYLLNLCQDKTYNISISKEKLQKHIITLLEYKFLRKHAADHNDDDFFMLNQDY